MCNPFEYLFGGQKRKHLIWHFALCILQITFGHLNDDFYLFCCRQYIRKFQFGQYSVSMAPYNVMSSSHAPILILQTSSVVIFTFSLLANKMLASLDSNTNNPISIVPFSPVFFWIEFNGMKLSDTCPHDSTAWHLWKSVFNHSTQVSKRNLSRNYSPLISVGGAAAAGALNCDEQLYKISTCKSLSWPEKLMYLTSISFGSNALMNGFRSPPWYTLMEPAGIHEQTHQHVHTKWCKTRGAFNLPFVISIRSLAGFRTFKRPSVLTSPIGWALIFLRISECSLSHPPINIAAKRHWLIAAIH